MSAALPHPNIEPPPAARLDSAALGAIFSEIQRNLDAITLSIPAPRPRELVGRISAAGAIGAGSGFTITHTEIGIYVLTFNTPFSAVPAVLANPFVDESAGSCQATSTTTTATIQPLTPAGAKTNAGFSVLIRQA